MWWVKNEGFPLTEPMAVSRGLCNCAACDTVYRDNILQDLQCIFIVQNSVAVDKSYLLIRNIVGTLIFQLLLQ